MHNQPTAKAESSPRTPLTEKRTRMTLFDCIMQSTILSDPVPLTVGEGDTVADIIEKEGTSALQGWLEMKWEQFLNLGLRVLIAVAVYFIVNQVLKHVLVRLDRQL